MNPYFGACACWWRESTGKPDAGNPLVRFDEGEGNSTPPYSTGGNTVIEDSVFGFRAAAPALICNNCLAEETIVRWDPENMRVQT